MTEASQAVVEACRLLSSEERIETRNLAAAIGLSSSYFQRCFKRQLGVTPQQFRRRILAERGRELLGQTPSVTESLYAAGYSSSSRFYEGLGRELGMKPASALAGAPGERIRYAIADCSLGAIVVAWTKRGVCEVGFGDTSTGLASRLAQHFPKARLEPADETNWVRAVIASVEMKSPPEIPLDMRGTAFQERVWQELRNIPIGETRTYSDIAAALGEPSAARAVARACATNKLAFVIPCHRVVRKGGQLAGYRWGIERKRELLAREAVAGSAQLEKT
jgi:AraC family transcriptional regulator of adaptative response/methylated-DNA-[protein]-cysteine methyltransferase